MDCGRQVVGGSRGNFHLLRHKFPFSISIAATQFGLNARQSNIVNGERATGLRMIWWSYLSSIP